MTVTEVLTLQPEPAIAWVFGQPVADIPKDLFIPPDALQVVLQNFEGPLDLLLYLIRKQNLDILDIPITQITEQYLSYIQQLKHQQFDLAAEYLLMAAMLVEIKSRLLLPKTITMDDAEEIDPRQELALRLLKYEQMRLAAIGLDELPQAGRDFAWAVLHVDVHIPKALPQVDIADLKQAWLAILSRAKNHAGHQVIQDAVSVRAQMSHVLRLLKKHGSCRFNQLFAASSSVTMLVVNFIAMLELIKEGLIYAEQNHAFADIDIFLNPTPLSESTP
ncbi:MULTISPECIES: segregation and condensation protein A [Vitreoscilla]|uniref:Segregation and condensation protein A n=1 Tax=Vitreoscilla stercoraria TaxID=61 RepID=A0ABY4EB71_VITST|nr:MULTISPECIES: ScpA family protein [Vitreoscilla]AUZ05926.1 segregation and condensation protein A [Vitreoscilla sp. C1]UOO92702.1 segregation/condensation protein A [Vitreoscilla stercoraria]